MSEDIVTRHIQDAGGLVEQSTLGRVHESREVLLAEGPAAQQGEVGVGRGDDLLEAIVDPNAKIAKGFETTIIVDFDGRIHTGIIKEETEAVVKLMTAQGAIISVAKDEIDERAKGQSGMPSDIAKNLSRDDVRDLIEYLASLKVAGDGSHGKTEE